MYKIFKFDLARNALRFIIKQHAIKEMHIPYYLCDVVRHTLTEENCKPLFYHIDDNFFPSKDFPKDDYILYPNYWGVCDKNVKKLVNIYPKVIVDNAHAYYNKPSGFACFNAGHKFGQKYSYAFIENDNDNMHIELSNQELINKRKNIFIQLHNQYKNINLLNLDTNSIPFCYPCLLDTEEKADKLVLLLKKDGKVIYRYWNNLPKTYNEYKFYSRLVPIPILD